jgi:hypothetical protein
VSTVSAEVQRQQDAWTQLEAEYKEQGARLRALNAVSIHDLIFLICAGILIGIDIYLRSG